MNKRMEIIVLFVILTFFAHFVVPEQFVKAKKQRQIEIPLGVVDVYASNTTLNNEVTTAKNHPFGKDEIVKALDDTFPLVSQNDANVTKIIDDSCGTECNSFGQHNENIRYFNQNMEFLNNTDVSRPIESIKWNTRLTPTKVLPQVTFVGQRSREPELKLEPVVELTQTADYEETVIYQPYYIHDMIDDINFPLTYPLRKSTEDKKFPRKYEYTTSTQQYNMAVKNSDYMTKENTNTVDPLRTTYQTNRFNTNKSKIKKKTDEFEFFQNVTVAFNDDTKSFTSTEIRAEESKEGPPNSTTSTDSLDFIEQQNDFIADVPFSEIVTEPFRLNTFIDSLENNLNIGDQMDEPFVENQNNQTKNEIVSENNTSSISGHFGFDNITLTYLSYNQIPLMQIAKIVSIKPRVSSERNESNEIEELPLKSTRPEDFLDNSTKVVDTPALIDITQPFLDNVFEDILLTEIATKPINSNEKLDPFGMPHTTTADRELDIKNIIETTNTLNKYKKNSTQQSNFTNIIQFDELQTPLVTSTMNESGVFIMTKAVIHHTQIIEESNVQNRILTFREFLALMKPVKTAPIKNAQEYKTNEHLGLTKMVNILLHLTSQFKYGMRQKIVLILEKMPNITAILSLSSSDYLIDFFISHFSDDTESKKMWKHTNFLNSALRRAGIREKLSLPFQSGYYRLISATFWKIGEHEIKLTLTDPMDVSHIYALETRRIYVTKEHKLMCYPKISVLNCGSPKNPKIVTVNKVVQFIVHVEEYCGAKNHGPVNWNLYNIAETELLKHIGKSKKFDFYTVLDASTVRSESPVLLLRVSTVIRGIVSVARCYIYVPPASLVPFIVGGQKHFISYSKATILDGSLSEDYSTPNKSIQAENMEWYCISFNDPGNSFCKKLHKSAIKLKIPAYTLRLGKTYQIFLRIRSKLYSFITKVARQDLQVIEDDVVYTPHIICRENCELGQYNPNRSVHLEAQCIDCPKKKRVSFEWFLNDEPYNFLMISGKPQHFVSFLKDSNDTQGSKIVLKMKVGRKSYQNAIILNQVEEPHIVFCHIVKDYKYDQNEKEERSLNGLFCREWWYDVNFYEIVLSGKEARINSQLDCWIAEPEPVLKPTLDPNLITDCEITKFWLICRPYCDIPRPEGVRLPIWSNTWDIRIETVDDPVVPVLGEYENFPLMLRLPETKQINITICNEVDQCISKLVNIDVTPVILQSTLSSFKSFLKDVQYLTDLKHTLESNNWQAGFIIAYTAAKRTNNYELLKYLYSQMSDYQTTSKIQLEQMMFLINTLLTNLRNSIDYRCANIFAQYFLTTAINMDSLAEKDVDINPRIYYIIEDSLLNMTASFSKAREAHMLAMCKPSDYSCNKGRDDSEYYKDFGALDPFITVKLSSWQQCATNLVRNIHMLGALAADNLIEKDYPVKRYKQNVFMVLHLIEKNTHHVELQSLDNMTKVYISVKLIEELQGKLLSDKIIMQLVTQPNDDGLFWWYPQPVPMSSSVLFVYALSTRRSWPDRLIHITNALVFDTNATKPYNRSDEMLMSGSLRSSLHIQTYRLVVAPGAILVLTVMSNTNPILVLIKLHKPPSGRQVNRHGCRIQANSKLKRIRMSNNCNSQADVFISVMPFTGVMSRTQSEEIKRQEIHLGSDVKFDQPLNYSFTLETYECTDWVDRTHSPGWTPSNCITIVDPDSNYTMRCSCNALGAFSPRIYPAFARLQADSVLDPKLAINWVLILLYVCLLMLLLFTLFSYMGSVRAHEKESMHSCDGVVQKDGKVAQGEDVIVVICTGGMENAGTSANVSLYFKSKDVPEVSYGVNQDPEHPKLKTNSTCTLKLGVGAIKLPAKLRIELDQQGRYPSWYCRTIIVHDLQHDSSQLFRVKRWIRNGASEWIESDYYSTPRQYVEPYTWRDRLRKTFEENFINWFLLQPILGPWLSSTNANSMNRYERTCVWICKLSACVAIAAFYFGANSTESHNIEKQEVNAYALNVLTVFIVAALCYMGCLAYDFVFHVIVMRFILRRY